MTRYGPRDRRPDPRYEEPFYWWGPGWETPAWPGLRDLLRDGTIDAWSAAMLWAAVARRRSLVVIAGPSGLGKTTLLTALLEFLPLGTRRVYPRGCFETFAFLSDPAFAPAKTALLINEISPHLPVYLWGPAVTRVLDAAECGFSLLATAHAETVSGFVGALTGSPLRIPAPRTALFEFVVLLGRSDRTQSGRRVRGVWRLSATRGGVSMDMMPSPPQNDISHEMLKPHDARPQPWFSVHELVDRVHILEDLRDGRIENLPEFQ